MHKLTVMNGNSTRKRIKRRINLRMVMIALLVLMVGLCAVDQAVMAQSDVGTARLSSFEPEAEQLREWGLFHGTSRGFELDREPTRAEAITMLVRLLGKESEARQTPDLKHPFTDVPAWSDATVAYAYANGLTSGVSPTLFGANQPVTVAQYCTFVLRALGFDDRKGEFDWRDAPRVIEQLGLGAKGEYGSFEGPFLRGHVVDISYHALFLEVKGQGMTLQDKLIEEGVLHSAAEVSGEEGSGEATETTEDGEEDAWTVKVPVRIEPNEWIPGSELIVVSDDVLKERLPGVRFESGHMSLGQHYTKGQTLEYVLLSNWSRKNASELHNPLNGERKYTIHNPSNPDSFDVRVLYDAEGNPIAYTSSDDLSADRAFLTYHTRLPLELELLVDKAAAIARKAVYIPHDALVVKEVEYILDYVEGEPVMATDKVVDIDRNRLPEGNWGITRRIQQAFSKPGMSISELGDLTDFTQNMQQQLYGNNRIGFALSFDYQPLQLGEYTGKWSLLFEFFLNDSDEIMAYTYFTDADLRAWADRVNRWPKE